MLDARFSRLYFFQRGLPAIACLLVRAYDDSESDSIIYITLLTRLIITPT